jgi:hypothetical protein
MGRLAGDVLPTVLGARRLGIVPTVSSIVLFGAQADRTNAFYRSVGVEFEEEDHGDGLIRAATEVGDVHVVVNPSTRAGLSTGLRVEAPSSGSMSTRWIALRQPPDDEQLARRSQFA